MRPLARSGRGRPTSWGPGPIPGWPGSRSGSGWSAGGRPRPICGRARGPCTATGCAGSCCRRLRARRWDGSTPWRSDPGGQGLHEAGEVTPTTITKAYRLLRRILNVAVEAAYLPATRRRSRAPGWSERPRCAMCRSRSFTPWPTRSRAGAGAGCAGVFPSGRGTYLQRSNLSRLVWRPVVQQLGLEGLRFHDLRHTAATLAAAAGGAVAAALDGLARDAEKNVWRRPRHVEGTTPRAGSGKKAAGS